MSDNSDCYFFVCKLIAALVSAVFSILSLIYGILALTSSGPFQTQNVTFGVIAVVLSVTGVCGVISFLLILFILAAIPSVIKIIIIIVLSPVDCCMSICKREQTNNFTPALTPLEQA